MPSAMSHRSASLSLSAILLARSTVLEKAASKVSAMGSMGRSIGIETAARKPGRSMFNIDKTSLQTHGMQAHLSCALTPIQKDGDIRDMTDIHAPIARCIANFLDRKTQFTPLMRLKVEIARET